MPDKPFFVYFAPGATHAPHHVRRGMVGQVQRAVRRRLGRAAGADVRAPEGARRHSRRRRARPRARRDPGLGRHARRAEAGARAADGGLRRLPRAHRPPRRPAASTPSRISASSTTRSSTTSSATTAPPPRARLKGTFNELIDPQRRGRARDDRVHGMRAIDDFGRPEAYNHYAVGWAHAMDTPYQWTKQVASHWGGTRNGTIVHWPNGIKAKGEVRTQFHHVIDIAPTVLEAAGLPEPTSSTASQQTPLEGVEHGLRFDDAAAAGAAHDAVLRDVLQPRHLPQGLDRGHPAHARRGWSAELPAVRRRRLGALRHRRRLDAGARPRRRAARRSSPSCSGCS